MRDYIETEDGYYLPAIEYCIDDDGGYGDYYKLYPDDWGYEEVILDLGLLKVWETFNDLRTYSEEECGERNMKHSETNDSKEFDLWNFPETLKDQLANSFNNILERRNICITN